MADNVLGSVRIEISGDYSRLEVDFKSAEKAAQSAGSKIASSMTVSMQSSAAATDQFSAAIDRLIAAQARENSALSLSIQRNAAMQNAARSTAGTIRQVGEESDRAEKKVKGFVGAIPMLGIAAERFVGMVPGLGNLLIKAFPVFGAIALADGLSRIATNVGEIAASWDPVLAAQKRSNEEAEKFSQSIAKVRKELQDIADIKFGDMFGPSALQGFQAANIGGQIADLRVKLAMAQAQASRTQGTGAIAGAAERFLPPGLSDVAGRFARGARIDAATQTQDVVLIQSQIRALEGMQAQFSRRSAKEQDKTNDDLEKKRKQAADKAVKAEQEGWEARYRIFEEALKQTQAARDRDLEDEKRYQEAMAEQKQRWAKINIDEKFSRLKQERIDAPLVDRLPSALTSKIDLNRAGIQTTDQRERAIANDQELLMLAQSINVPLGTQLRMREQILQDQIALKEQQGQSVSQELQALDAIQAQMDRMRQKAAGIAPMLHDLRMIGGSIPGQLGGALAGGVVSGSPGKAIGQEIRGALQGIGQQILGTVFQAAIQRLVVSLGINTLANTLLKFVFGGAAATQIANTAAVAANTVGQGVLAVSNTALTAAVVGLTGAVAALTTATTVDAIIPFADGGRPPLGVPSIVGERGPELFIPDQAGKIVPNHQLMGGAGLMLPMMAAIASNSVGSMNFHAHGMTNPREFVREVARQLPAYLKSTNPKYSPASR